MLRIFKNATPEALAEVAEEKRVRGTKELFLLFSMGSQFDHLIKQMLERLGVFCLVADPAVVTANDVRAVSPTGVIISGGPASVHSEPPPFDSAILDLGTPVLGICLGFQMIAKHLGVAVLPGENREFGKHWAKLENLGYGIASYVIYSELFRGCLEDFWVLQSHGDRVVAGTDRFTVTATTANSQVAAAENVELKLYGVQFHPEVPETEAGERIFENFCFQICGAKDRFPAKDIATRKILDLHEQIGDKRILLALSGGSDSATVAYLLKEAVKAEPDFIHAVYIRGIDRPEDEDFVRRHFNSKPWLTLHVVDATESFLEALRGKLGMYEKRLAVRQVYRAVLEEWASRLDADFIAQGTLYTDICESGGGHSTGARRARIKLHHNTDLGFSIPELTPLGDCVKDGGRNIGRAIGVPEELLTRHPFPGPGLVVRIEGEVTAEKLAIARQTDGIYIDELRKHGLYEKLWQAGAVVTQSMTTCSKGDDADSGCVIALWAVWSVNGFTAQAAELPWDFLKAVDQRITNEVRAVGTVAYRISGKPPTTIEWG